MLKPHASWLSLVPLPVQEDEFARLSGSTPKESTSHQDELSPPAEDASLAVSQLPERPVPHVPEVLVRFCMS